MFKSIYLFIVSSRSLAFKNAANSNMFIFIFSRTSLKGLTLTILLPALKCDLQALIYSGDHLDILDEDFQEDFQILAALLNIT